MSFPWRDETIIQFAIMTVSYLPNANYEKHPMPLPWPTSDKKYGLSDNYNKGNVSF